MSIQIPTPEELAALPPWYYTDDTSQTGINVAIAFLVINTVVYIFFIASRIYFAERNTWEIWVLPPFSYFFTTILCILTILIETIGGGGRHVAYHFVNDPTILTTFLKLQTAAESIYMAAVMFPKASILALYLMIFTDRKLRIVTWVLLAITIGHAVGSIISSFTICQPYEYKWNKNIDGHCADLMAGYRYVSVPNIATDVAILILPVATLWRLKMSVAKKIGLLLTFAIGGLGIITAIIRFVGFYTSDLFSDPTWFATNLMIYTIVEPSAYFICSCFPGIRPLTRAFYKGSGLRSMVDSYYNKQSISNDVSLGHNNVSKQTSISSAAPIKNWSYKGNSQHFVRMEDSSSIEV